jgi:hypothetical protein
MKQSYTTLENFGSVERSFVTTRGKKCCISAPGKNVTLVQNHPCWILHALLRIKGVPYSTKKCGYSTSVGKPLPLLIDGNYVLTERSAIRHVYELIGEEIEIEDQVMKSDLFNFEIVAIKYYSLSKI